MLKTKTKSLNSNLTLWNFPKKDRKNRCSKIKQMRNNGLAIKIEETKNPSSVKKVCSKMKSNRNLRFLLLKSNILKLINYRRNIIEDKKDAKQKLAIKIKGTINTSICELQSETFQRRTEINTSVKQVC